MAVDRDFVIGLDSRNHARKSNLETISIGARLRADIETDHCEVGHDVVGAAPVNPGRIDAQTLAIARLQGDHKGCRGDNGIAPVLWVAPRVCRPAMDNDAVIAAASTFSGERSVRQGCRFKSQSGKFAFGEFGN